MALICYSNWIQLGNYYRKFSIYDMQWLQNQYESIDVLIGAPYGGPLGIINKSILHVHTCSGSYLSSFELYDLKKMIQVEWSTLDHLVCVYDHGFYKIFDVLQKTAVKSYDMFSFDKNKKQKIIDARFFHSYVGTGLAILTSTYQFFLVNNVYNPKRRTFSKIHGNIDYFNVHKIWSVLSFSRSCDIIYAIDLNIFKLKEDESKPVQLYFERTHDCKSSNQCYVVDMAVTLNGKHFAFICNNGVIWMGSSDFQEKYVEFNTETNFKPTGFYWCGTEAVICSFSKSVFLISKQGKHTIFKYNSRVHLVEEIDCVRIISDLKHEIVQKVPNMIQEMFRINSTSVGHYLFEAFNKFKSESHRADEYLLLIKDDLPLAVDQCIEAAAYEFDIDSQIILLKTAQYGKCYTADYDNSTYVETCHILRVLNSIRKLQIGMPLTYKQYECLTSKNLIDKLITRKHFWLAIEISKYLNIESKHGRVNILTKWAMYKITAANEDENTFSNQILENLTNVAGIPFHEIAKKANEEKKKPLALKLLANETKANLQVDLFIELKEINSAIEKSLENGDCELIYSVMLKLVDLLTTGDFLLSIRYKFLAALFIKHCEITDSSRVFKVFNQSDYHFDMARFFLTEYINSKDVADDNDNIRNAKMYFKKAKKDIYFLMCEQTMNMRTLQKQLQTKFNINFLGKSTLEMISMIIALRDMRLAEKMKADYRITDRKFFLLQIQVLRKNNMFNELDQLTKNKKFPNDLMTVIQKIQAKK